MRTLTDLPHTCCVRDLKPDNIVIDANDHVRIIDFGSARPVPDDDDDDDDDGDDDDDECSSDDYVDPDDEDAQIARTEGRRERLFERKAAKKRQRETAAPSEAADDLSDVMKDGTNTTLAEDAVQPGAAGGMMTSLVVTWTYRAPEIERQLQELHQSRPKHEHEWHTHYGQPVDIWSVGVVFGELLSCACGVNDRNRHLFASKLPQTKDEEANGKNMLHFIDSEYKDNSRKIIDRHYEGPGMLRCAGATDALDLLEQMLRVDWQVR
jgi:serine/threonine protein kinase